MNMKELATLVSKKEGKKKQTSIGNIREVLKIVSILMVKDPHVIELLIRNGRRLSK